MTRTAPLIPAQSRPKDGVLSHAYAGIQSYENELDPRLHGGKRTVWLLRSPDSVWEFASVSTPVP